MAPRPLKVAAAQVGSIHLSTPKSSTINRLIALLQSAITQSVQLVVFPETTFTTFFPRHLIPSPSLPFVELNTFFELGDDSHGITENEDVAALFTLARTGKIDIVVGYAERCDDGRGFNTCIYYSGGEGRVLSKYRKVHLPGTREPFEDAEAVNQLEKRYFEVGDLGFRAFRAPGLIPNALSKKWDVGERGEEDGDGDGDGDGRKKTQGRGDPIIGMMICNDRRWPEAWRVYGLQGVELICCGYNTPTHAPHLYGALSPTSPSSTSAAAAAKGEVDAYRQHKLVMEANSYMNSCFSISAARAGCDDGKYGLIGGSSVVSPQGYTIAEAQGTGDELVVAEVDLEECRVGKGSMFDFERHRRVEAYGLIVGQTGVVEPGLLE